MEPLLKWAVTQAERAASHLPPGMPCTSNQTIGRYLARLGRAAEAAKYLRRALELVAEEEEEAGGKTFRLVIACDLGECLESRSVLSGGARADGDSGTRIGGGCDRGGQVPAPAAAAQPRRVAGVAGAGGAAAGGGRGHFARDQGGSAGGRGRRCRAAWRDRCRDVVPWRGHSPLAGVGGRGPGVGRRVRALDADVGPRSDFHARRHVLPLRWRAVGDGERRGGRGHVAVLRGYGAGDVTHVRFFIRSRFTSTVSNWAAAALAGRLAEEPTLGAADRAFCRAAAQGFAE